MIYFHQLLSDERALHLVFRSHFNDVGDYWPTLFSLFHNSNSKTRLSANLYIRLRHYFEKTIITAENEMKAH